MVQNRQNWFNVTCGLTFESIVDKLNNEPYTDKKHIGFDAIELQPKKFISRYIERQDIVNEVIHPYGGIERINITQYIVFNFEIISIKEGNFLLKIINPPKSIKNYVKTLSDLFIEGFYIEKIGINVEDCFKSLLKTNNISRYSIERLIVSRLPFGDKTTATITLRSTGNAYKEFKKRYKDIEYRLDRMKIRLRFNNEWEFVELSSSGLISCASALDSLIERYIESQQLQ